MKWLSQKNSVYLVIIIAQIIWSCSFLLTKEALIAYTPNTVVTIRIFLATLFLLSYGLITRQLELPNKKDIWLFLLAGFAQPFAYFTCEAYGLTLVSPTVASVIMSMIPLFAPFFAWLILRESVTWANLLGIIISFAGVSMIVITGGTFDVNIFGIVLLFGAILSAITYTIVLRKIPSHYSNISIVFYMHLTSLLFFIPTFLLTDYQSMDSFVFRGKSIIAIVVLALFASFMAFVFFCKAVRVIGVTRANAFNNLMPAITAIAMWVIFNETLPLIKWLGIVIVIAGLFICQMNFKKNK